MECKEARMAYSRMRTMVCSPILFACIFLSGCGKDSESGPAQKPITPPITGNSDFLGKVSATSFFCDEAECPSYTVAVAVNNLGNIHPTWCTGTVLKNGQVLTSKSCFGEFFFEAKTSCQDHVLIKNLSGKVFGCSKIIAVSETKSEDAVDSATKIDDYVLLEIPEISASRYPSLAEQKGDLTPGQETSVWIANHLVEAGLEVALEHKKCFYQNKSLISPWGMEGDTSHLFLSKCELPKSARGAAILDSSNKLSGVVHTISSAADLEIWDLRVLEGEVLAHYALGNTLSCTALGNNDYSYCDQNNYSDIDLTELRKSIFTHFDDLEVWDANIKKYAESDLHKYLRWTSELRYVNQDLLYEVDFIPTCFTYGKIWLQEFRGGILNMFYLKEASIFKAWPNYQLFSGLNGHFNAQTDLADNGEQLYEIKFSPRDLKEKNKTNLTVINTKNNSLIVELKDVPFCQ